MRWIATRHLAVALLLTMTATLPAQDDVRAVIEKAITAHGGQEKISRIKAVRTTTRGTLIINGSEASFTGETVAQLPGQIKNVIECEVGGKKQSVVQIVNGDKVSLSINGLPQAVGEKVLAELKELQYAERVKTLLPLLDDRSLELASLGESKINGVTAVGIRVTSKGHRDLVLHFDRTTGLMVMSESRAFDSATQAEVSQKEYYGDYKDINGLKKPMKLAVRKDDKPFMKVDVVEIRYLDKLDEKVFEQP
jgi:hypothetical protein